MPQPKPLRGRVTTLHINSTFLLNNVLDDPAERAVQVYEPESLDPADSVPMLWYLAAYSNSGAAAGNWRGFDENVFQRVERLIDSEAIGPCRVLAPDCFTRLGGSQYIDSAGVGNHQSYLAQEVMPAVQDIRSTSWHGVFGKSSGGYGALRLAMAYPQLWSAAASHAGDVGFENVYRSDFPKVARTLARDRGEIDRFLKRFWNARNRGGDDFLTLMTLCMAATYDPDPASPERIRLPFDPRTLEIDPARWSAWTAHDPLNLLEENNDALRSLGALYLDCGSRDQYHLQFGTLRLHEMLTALGINHHYESFDGTHSGMDYRFDTSLPYLYRTMESLQ